MRSVNYINSAGEILYSRLMRISTLVGFFLRKVRQVHSFSRLH